MLGDVTTPRRVLPSRRLGRALVVVCLVLFGAPTTSHAQGTLASRSGFGFDVNLDGGLAAALDGNLDNNFLGRLRLGGVYVTEPWVLALGVTGELGALAKYGFGVAAELSHLDGLWGRVGGSRVQGDDWMTQLTLGYLFFGLEWQHRFAHAVSPQDALVLVFRVPLGMWWFLMRDPPQSSQRAMAVAATAHDPSGREAADTAVSVGDRLLASRLLEEATLAEQQQHWREAADLLTRALRLDPAPLLTLRLSRAQRKVGRLVLSADNLRRFLDSAATPPELAARADAEAERLEVLGLLCTLRLRVEPLADDESVWLDGEPFSVAALGYPFPIDPGPHTIVVKRGADEILRREIQADAGGVVQLTIDPQAPTEVRDASP